MGINLKRTAESRIIRDLAAKDGIRLIDTKKAGEVRLCFAGIADSDIYPAIKKLKECIYLNSSI